MQQKDYVESLLDLIGPKSPDARLVRFAREVPGMEGPTLEILRGLLIEKGLDPDDPPLLGLPHDITPSDYPIGTAMSGDVPGEEVGPSDVDLPSHIGVFGMTSVGKTTAVKILLLAFTGKLGQRHE